MIYATAWTNISFTALSKVRFKVMYDTIYITFLKRPNYRDWSCSVSWLCCVYYIYGMWLWYTSFKTFRTAHQKGQILLYVYYTLIIHL